MIKPKKSLGQNFLRDKNILQEIASHLEIKDGDIVIEIGSGEGTLTEALLSSPASKIISIEKDKRLAEALKKKFDDKRLSIIEGDALLILSSLKLNQYKLIGNIPYYITGHLLRIIGDLENKPETSLFVVQKEVAERATSNKKTSLLSLSLQFWSKPEYIKTINRNLFYPIPKVDSAILKLMTITSPEVNKEAYFNILKHLFSHPRKTILNNLSSLISKEMILKTLDELNLSPSLRAEDLNQNQIIQITKQIYKSNL